MPPKAHTVTLTFPSQRKRGAPIFRPYQRDRLLARLETKNESGQYENFTMIYPDEKEIFEVDNRTLAQMLRTSNKPRITPPYKVIFPGYTCSGLETRHVGRTPQPGDSNSASAELTNLLQILGEIHATQQIKTTKKQRRKQHQILKEQQLTDEKQESIKTPDLTWNCNRRDKNIWYANPKNPERVEEVANKLAKLGFKVWKGFTNDCVTQYEMVVIEQPVDVSLIATLKRLFPEEQAALDFLLHVMQKDGDFLPTAQPAQQPAQKQDAKQEAKARPGSDKSPATLAAKTLTKGVLKTTPASKHSEHEIEATLKTLKGLPPALAPQIMAALKASEASRTAPQARV